MPRLLKEPSKIDMLECYQILHGLVEAFPIQSYLEIGVREGASLCCVLAKEQEITEFVLLCLTDGFHGLHYLSDKIVARIADGFTLRNKDLRLYLFDNWSYPGSHDGHERVVNMLENGFKTHNYQIYDGDSKVTVPAFFKKHKGKVDLTFVDGDHTAEGAKADLENVWQHSKIIVMHDLFNPEHLYLENVFIDFARKHGLPYLLLGRKAVGTGVAFNIW